MRILSACWPLLWASTAWGQIMVPSEIPAHKPIVATLADIVPEGAKLDCNWRLTGGEFVRVDGRTIHIWAAPGRHVLTARGYWLLTKRIVLPDGQEFDALLGFGQIDHEAEFVVTGGSPVPPPPPPGPRWAVILEETSERTPQQAALWGQIRKEFKSGPKVLILDDDSPDAAAYLRPANAVPRPALVVFALDGAEAVVSAVPCPQTLAEIKQVLGL